MLGGTRAVCTRDVFLSTGFCFDLAGVFLLLLCASKRDAVHDGMEYFVVGSHRELRIEDYWGL